VRGRIPYYQFVSKEGIPVQAFTAGDSKPESVLRICQLVGYAKFWSLRHKLSIDSEEDSHSGLVRTPGTRVGCKHSGVRIPHPPLLYPVVAMITGVDFCCCYFIC